MPVKPVDIKGSKILFTGIGGQVALPVASYYAKHAEVWGLARFGNEATREQVEKLNIRPFQADLAKVETLAELPDDFDYVVNFAVVRSGNFDYDLAANAEGIGHLIAHCRHAKAVLHCSSTAVYQYEGPTPRTEDAPLGDNHRAMFPTYSIAKIAAETVARFAARHFQVPTVITRLSVPYGDNGGWPLMHYWQMKKNEPITIHPQRPNLYNPLHNDDFIYQLPWLLGAAEKEAVTVNYGGSEPVSVESWCEWIGKLTGLVPSWQESEQAFGALPIDTTRMHRLIPPSRVDWHEGIRSMLQKQAPESLLSN